MIDHPSTFRADDTHSEEIEWDDRAALLLSGHSDGLLQGFQAVRRGSFAELIAQMMAMPEEERRGYVIEKAGDREFGLQEVAELASRPDYPGRRGG